MRTRTAVAGIGGAAAVGVALQVLGRVAGSTSEERGAALPGDELGSLRLLRRAGPGRRSPARGCGHALDLERAS